MTTATYESLTPKVGDVIEYTTPALDNIVYSTLLGRVIKVYSDGDVDICAYELSGHKISKYVSRFYINKIVPESQAKSLLALESCFGKWI